MRQRCRYGYRGEREPGHPKIKGTLRVYVSEGTPIYAGDQGLDRWPRPPSLVPTFPFG